MCGAPTMHLACRAIEECQDLCLPCLYFSFSSAPPPLYNTPVKLCRLLSATLPGENLTMFPAFNS